MVKEKCVVSTLNIIISHCFYNHVGEFYSKKKRKEKKSVAIVVSFQNTLA